MTPGFRRGIVSLTLILVGGCSRPRDVAPYSGTIEFQDVKVGSLVGGRVTEVGRREGEPAATGDVLVRLDPADWQGALEEAQAKAVATQRELDLLLAGARAEEVQRAEADAKRQELLWTIVAEGARPEEVAAAKEDVNAAIAMATEASLANVREQKLAERKVASGESLEKMRAAEDTAKARVAAAEQRLRLLERGSRPAEIEAARQAYLAAKAQADLLRAGPRAEEVAAHRATLEAAEARIRMAESKIRELVIRAPADCFVQSLDLRPGDLIAPAQPVAVLVLRERPWITIYVPESDLARVQVGQAAAVKPDGVPAFEGKVTWISRQAEYTPRNVQTASERVTQVFAVKVVLEGDVALLKDGLWADVTLR